MKQKNIVATLYLKDGHAVRSMTDFTPVDANVYRLCQLYNDSGVDKIIIFDLSTSDDEHEKNVNTIRNINRNIDIKVCAGGNINRLEDIKKLLFAGCLQVILNASKPSGWRRKPVHVLAKTGFCSLSTMWILFLRIRIRLKIHSMKHWC